MARIDWALLCDHAFLDRVEQLSIIGITRSLLVPRLPCARSCLVLVARLAEIGLVDEIEVAVTVVTPSGRQTRPGPEQVVIEVCREYVLATLFDIPFLEEGNHQFQIQLRGRPAVAVEIPVLVHPVRSAAVLQ